MICRATIFSDELCFLVSTRFRFFGWEFGRSSNFYRGTENEKVSIDHFQLKENELIQGSLIILHYKRRQVQGNQSRGLSIGKPYNYRKLISITRLRIFWWKKTSFLRQNVVRNIFGISRCWWSVFDAIGLSRRVVEAIFSGGSKSHRVFLLFFECHTRKSSFRSLSVNRDSDTKTKTDTVI